MIVTMTMVMSAAMLVAMVPQLGFIEQKKEHQTHQQGREQLTCARLAFKGLGQQVHKGSRQQCASRQTEHVLGVAGEHSKTQKSGQPDAANTGSQRTHEDGYQSHYLWRFYLLGQGPY